MISWAKQQTNAFGASFLWLVCLVYFTQGFRSFVWTAVSYQLKDKLKLSPSVSQYVTSIAFFPWSIKPLYGIVSDCIPINGQRRVPYLIIASILSLVPWPILGLSTTLRNSRSYLIIFLTLQNLGSAMADVVIDAMIAESVRFERACFAGDLQSVSWFSMALGGIFGSLLGGYALTSFPIGTIFMFFSVLPAVQLLSCGLYRDNALALKKLQNPPDFNGNGVGDVVDGFPDNDSKKSTARRKKNHSSDKKSCSTRSSEDSKRKRPFSLSWFHSIKIATQSLLSAFRQPLILRPMAWFFLANIAVPNLSTVMFYFQTEKLHMDASFLGAARVIGWLGLMLGTFFYNRYLKKMKLRNILMLTHVGLSLLNLFDVVLVSRINFSLGISDKVMVAVGSALADGINQFKFMPFLILSGRLCPPGIEGTLFALFMSINNLGATVGSLHGAVLSSLLKLSSGSYDNMLVGIIIQFMCTYIPVVFLFLVPRNATGSSA